MIDAIRELYAAGVDSGVESYQDVGVLAWIVVSGHRVERCFAVSELDQIGEWLRAEAVASTSAEGRPKTAKDARDILAGLAASRRKDPHRVSLDERRDRRGMQDGEHQLAG